MRDVIFPPVNKDSEGPRHCQGYTSRELRVPGSGAVCVVLVLCCAWPPLLHVGLLFPWEKDHLGNVYLTRLFVFRNGGDLFLKKAVVICFLVTFN